jgi:RNA polymerase sigma-70 factor (ECF subfamily)
MSEEAEKLADEDRALVEAFKIEHAKEAFDRSVVKYQDKVFNLCYRFMGNYHDANDCAQDTFIKVYRSLKKFRFESSFSTWLYRIAVNTCKNKLSSLQYRLSKIMFRIDKPAESGLTIEIKDESRSPEVVLERSEKGRLIQKEIDSLPGDQKTVVVLRDIEALPYEEIAQITGYNMGTVKSKLARARERLRKKLRGLI